MFDITYETENTILLIKSIGINYPILREWGFELTKPLFWVVDRGQLHTAVKLFGNGKTPVLNEFTFSILAIQKGAGFLSFSQLRCPNRGSRRNSNQCNATDNLRRNPI